MNKAEQLIQKFKSKLDIFNLFLSERATDEEITKAEKIIGITFPKTLKDLLRITNGEGNKKYKYGIGLGILGLYFLSIDEIIMEWQRFKEWDDYEKEVYQERLLITNIYNPKRIPFASDGSGQLLCIDFDPNTHGDKGQIIYLPCGEPEPTSVIAKNFDDYVEFIIKSIETERIVLVDEREDWDEEDWENAELYFEKTWKDDWTDVADEYNANMK
ncbi:SMI1/KNR4 family protein [Aquimarina sp. 2201CG5-10]|uniref:SMI1/KNR4 family protein n=1 Tax=Aquimarina callyspongiae TaxID=3098150 RepID=UPI002AB3F798|nr:SMI1/KNR4 family protein [Aquimarina sp. 2201CG5-10]MDY8137489.1 SMI1/KNR4 family protein [Aquimarina sp. 2201CG5-10]